MKQYIAALLLLVMGAIFMSVEGLSEVWEEIPMLSRSSRLQLTPVVEVPHLPPLAKVSRISSSFGMRRHPILKRRRMHWGLDFSVKEGTPVLAAAGGIVQEIETDPEASTYGLYLRMDHDRAHSTLYAHLSKILVRECQEVARGDTIALSGNTGLSTSPHLHFEVFRKGKRVNPLPFLPPDYAQSLSAR